MKCSNIRFLLVNPSYRSHYRHTKIREGAIYPPPLNLAVLGASLKKCGHEVRVMDFNLARVNDNVFKKTLLEFAPAYVGFTFSTPLFNEMNRLCKIVKETNSDIKTVGGGAHASSLPLETLRHSELDIVVIGEADFILPKIVDGKGLSPDGIIYKEANNIFGNYSPNHIVNLDELPFPLWNIYSLRDYIFTTLLVRKSPAAFLETSRGCPFNCPYCNKNVFGNKFRTKSASRVIEEMKYMQREGFNEIFLADDNFSYDMERAKKICEGILSSGLKIPWTPLTGLRIDRVDRELLELMYRSGCYRVYYGVESGSQKILDELNRGFTLAQVKDVVRQSKEAGLEVFGFFMIGFPGETLETMKETIYFSHKVEFDMVKLSILTPLPNTALFNQYDQKGLIKTRDWAKYNLYDVKGLPHVYTHPKLDWRIINKFYHKFYQSFYLRPTFIIKRLLKAIRRGTFFDDLRHFLNTRWW